MTIMIGEFELLILDFNFLYVIIIVNSAFGLNGLRRYISLLLLLLLSRSMLVNFITNDGVILIR